MTHTDAASSFELPPGWTESRVRDVIAHYESQSDDEAIAEDESVFEADDYTVMAVPLRTRSGRADIAHGVRQPRRRPTLRRSHSSR